jgi:glycosyltransferase involved in cell wall biosynthesis
MMASPWYDVYIARKYKQFRSRIKTPKVSVIIPAWNEEVGIVSTINSVIHNYYKNIEIIVINDGSTDNTEQVILEYIAKLSKKKRNKITYKYKKN